MTRHLSARRLTLAGLLIAGGLLVTMRPPMRTAFATIQTPTGRSLRVEIADTSAARARGLSGRPTLDSDGMLLTFSEAAPHAIWMKDMEFALDLIWLDSEDRVLAVIAHAPVCRDDRLCTLYLPLAATGARHVLELPAGRADDAGLEVGRSLRVQRPQEPVSQLPFANHQAESYVGLTLGDAVGAEDLHLAHMQSARFSSLPRRLGVPSPASTGILVRLTFS